MSFRRTLTRAVLRARSLGVSQALCLDLYFSCFPFDTHPRYSGPIRCIPRLKPLFMPSPSGMNLGIGRTCYRRFSLTAPPAFRQELTHNFAFANLQVGPNDLVNQAAQSGFTPMVRSSACSVPLTLNQRGLVRVQFPGPVDCLRLRRQNYAGPPCVGSPDSVVALRAPLHEQLIIRHFRPPSYILPQYVVCGYSRAQGIDVLEHVPMFQVNGFCAHANGPSFVLSSPIQV